MLAAEHVLSYLHGTWNQTIRYSPDSHETPNVLWGWWMRIGPEILTPDDLKWDAFS